MDAHAIPEPGLVEVVFAADHIVVAVDDKADNLHLGHATGVFLGRRTLHFQPDRHINLFAAVSGLAQTADAVHAHIDHLAGDIHFPEGGGAFRRRGNRRAGHIDRITGTGGQKGGTTQNGGQRKKTCARLVFHAAHPICFFI